MVTGWELLQANELDAAISKLTEEWQENPIVGTAANLCLGYLCANRPADALCAIEAIRRKPPKTATCFVLAGISSWLLSERERAKSLWIEGLDSIYADAAGGIQLPLLLMFAAIRDPTVHDLRQAEKLLRERLKSPWAERNWPAPLARFVLGQISEEQLRADASQTHELVARRRLTQTEFYVGLAALRSSKRAKFLDSMRICARAPQSELVKERYLAKHELLTEAETRGQFL